MKWLRRVWGWVESPDDQLFGPIQDGYYEYSASLGVGRMVASWASHFLINFFWTLLLGVVSAALGVFVAVGDAIPSYGGGAVLAVYWLREIVDLYREGAPETRAGKADVIGDWITALSGFVLALLIIT